MDMQFLHFSNEHAIVVPNNKKQKIVKKNSIKKTYLKKINEY